MKSARGWSIDDPRVRAWDRKLRRAFTLWDRSTAYGCAHRNQAYEPDRQRALWDDYQQVIAAYRQEMLPCAA